MHSLGIANSRNELFDSFELDLLRRVFYIPNSYLAVLATCCLPWVSTKVEDPNMQTYKVPSLRIPRCRPYTFFVAV